MPDVADENATKDIAREVPADTQNREDTVYEEAPYCDNTAEEGMGDKVDSIEELCDDVMPSPSREVSLFIFQKVIKFIYTTATVE